jgi:hypothetical protein
VLFIDFCVLTFVSFDDRDVLIVLEQFYYIYQNESHEIIQGQNIKITKTRKEVCPQHLIIMDKVVLLGVIF